MKAQIALLFGCFVAVYSESIQPYGIVNDLIMKLLNGIRPELKNMSIAELPIEVHQKGVNLSFLGTDLSFHDLDLFDVYYLDSSLLPLKINNITLNLNHTELVGHYDIKGSVDSVQGPVELSGNGEVRVAFENLNLTLAAAFTSSGGKIQIKPNGLSGVDVNVPKCDITLENFMEDDEIGKTITLFLSFFVPELVNDFKYDFIAANVDAIIAGLNEWLKTINFP